jgi:hypothetical protein
MTTAATTTTTSSVPWQCMLGKAATNGIVGGAISWAMFNKIDAARLFGMNVARYVSDAILIAISSATGDMLSSYIIPALQTSFVNNPNALSWMTYLAPSVITGATFALAEPLLVSPQRYMISNGVAQPEGKLRPFLLGSLSKLGGDALY